jgi:hypothetical protein
MPPTVTRPAATQANAEVICRDIAAIEAEDVQSFFCRKLRETFPRSLSPRWDSTST